MKVSISRAKRVWMYWPKNRHLLPIENLGKNKELDGDSKKLNLQIHKEQNIVQDSWRRSETQFPPVGSISKRLSPRSGFFPVSCPFKIRFSPDP